MTPLTTTLQMIMMMLQMKTKVRKSMKAKRLMKVRTMMIARMMKVKMKIVMKMMKAMRMVQIITLILTKLSLHVVQLHVMMWFGMVANS